ncbi:hypothetical protein RIF25_11880 [Thermosynechococcaceae cyanobacterium BACA0444]|uniref:Uncharacterized protein n=1 Tax=Pseudocalidococcus azoricus BACA0444 TaxID=2918990 RepID=A0AAE4FV71_9CYAN|nr:hypothetical protein [Pseudocalidococcus azoricus]MDS3861505.1 hypothetical protein [Pseudocalidococcus azoricus BACA0444]
MNMSLVPLDSDQQRLEEIRQAERAISRLIQAQHVNTNQGKLVSQAKDWGWQVVKGGGKHPVKAIRPGYSPVVICGHGSSRTLKRGTALGILQALAEPIRAELNRAAQTILEQITQQKLTHQEARIATLEAELMHFQAEAETGLALAAEVEARNGILNRQMTKLLHERLELDVTKQKLMAIIQERQQIEAKFALFIADFEQLEMILDRVTLFAEALPEAYQRQLLQILHPIKPVA